MNSGLSAPSYPPIRISADKASAVAQRTFLILNRAQLTLLTLTAFAAGMTFSSPAHQHWAAWCICVLMLLTLVLSSALRVGKFDDRWFRCRAYAENLKGAVWRFIMSHHDGTRASETAYLNEIKQLNERLPDLQGYLAKYGVSGALITDWMRSAHALPFDQKIAMYREFRIKDQADWYSDRSRYNSRMEQVWFWLIFGSEFVALVIAAIEAWQLPGFNPVSGVATVGASCIAWFQLKRFSDLGTSYAIAATDLQRIGETHVGITTQHEIDVMVQEVETAVSREHSMWLARRLVV